MTIPFFEKDELCLAYPMDAALNYLGTAYAGRFIPLIAPDIRGYRFEIKEDNDAVDGAGLSIKLLSIGKESTPSILRMRYTTRFFEQNFDEEMMCVVALQLLTIMRRWKVLISPKAFKKLSLKDICDYLEPDIIESLRIQFSETQINDVDEDSVCFYEILQVFLDTPQPITIDGISELEWWLRIISDPVTNMLNLHAALQKGLLPVISIEHK